MLIYLIGFSGITYLQKKWFQHSSVYDCIYHIKDDIKAPKLGNADDSEIKEFDKVWTELDITKFEIKLQVCNQNIHPKVSHYINKSIDHEHSNPWRRPPVGRRSVPLRRPCILPTLSPARRGRIVQSGGSPGP